MGLTLWHTRIPLWKNGSAVVHVLFDSGYLDLAVCDDAVQRLTCDLANAALAIVSALSVDFIDLDQRLDQVALVGIPGRTIWIFESVFHLPYSTFSAPLAQSPLDQLAAGNFERGEFKDCKWRRRVGQRL
jgi:hypothetical protein